MAKRIIIYHDDADGQCAAAIAALHARQETDADWMDLEFIPMDYGRKLPVGMFIGTFPGAPPEVWLIDFSLPEDEMDALANSAGPELVWIDHHVTAIEKLEKFRNVHGARAVDKAACLLTWEFCGMMGGVPLAVKLIADRDIWKFEYGDQSRFFHAALALYDTHPARNVWEFFWLKPEERLEKELAEGRAIYLARRKRLADVLKAFGRVEKLHGTDMTVLSVNYPGSGDLGEIGRELGHEVVHAYVDQEKDSRLCRVHNLYSETVDVGTLAKERGRGGHRAAAGWVERL